MELLQGIFIGLIIGVIITYIFLKKEKQTESKEESVFDYSEVILIKGKEFRVGDEFYASYGSNPVMFRIISVNELGVICVFLTTAGYCSTANAEFLSKDRLEKDIIFTKVIKP